MLIFLWGERYIMQVLESAMNTFKFIIYAQSSSAHRLDYCYYCDTNVSVKFQFTQFQNPI